ncbi:hypothetical protein T492DRAFT_1001505 [Pavlovales sp. CCMP2436]|nr:hypothetical protein T492DRAFT_1001505 [Pavlovales sp. CCMP2436]
MRSSAAGGVPKPNPRLPISASRRRSSERVASTALPRPSPSPVPGGPGVPASDGWACPPPSSPGLPKLPRRGEAGGEEKGGGSASGLACSGKGAHRPSSSQAGSATPRPGDEAVTSSPHTHPTQPPGPRQCLPPAPPLPRRPPSDLDESPVRSGV